MEENLSQFTEEEYVSKYNYEDFVRIIKKDEKIISKSNNIEEGDFKENQKDILINTTHSSDLTSVSLSQAENLSQTSDNMLIVGDIRLNNISENQTEGKHNSSSKNISNQKHNLKRKAPLLIQIIKTGSSARYRKQIHKKNYTKTKYSILYHIFYYN